MTPLPVFYRDEQEWFGLVERLKLIPCPQCQKVGFLIQHGYLYGCERGSPHRHNVRGHRLFCSNRHQRTGCGQTCSVWLADKIQRRCVTARSLWSFFQHAVTGSLAAAIRAAERGISERTWFRYWQRLDHAQCALRTTLSDLALPPDWSGARSPTSRAELLAHLQALFPDPPCPLAAYQLRTHRHFFSLVG